MITKFNTCCTDKPPEDCCFVAVGVGSRVFSVEEEADPPPEEALLPASDVADAAVGLDDDFVVGELVDVVTGEGGSVFMIGGFTWAT